MTLTLGFDASSPPAAAYPNAGAVLGYIGGNTPHVWTVAEWLRFQHLRQFPIWVGYQESDPAEHAREAVDAMERLGWTPHANTRRAVIVDEETQVDGPWINTFAQGILDGGYVTIVYESLAVLLDNPHRTGVWVADWNNVPQLPEGFPVIGCQYRANVAWENTQVDLSVLSDAMIIHGGYGPRHGA
jgi:hypothetical protein